MLLEAVGRVAAGAVVGLGGAWAASAVMQSLVFGIRPTSPLVYAGVVALLALVAATAAIVPATRASRLDPLTAQRSE